MADSIRSRSFLLGGIFVLMVLYTLYFAAPILLPITLALLLSLVLTPLVRGLAWLHIPAPIGAAIVLVMLLGFLVEAVYLLSGPASEWLDKAPERFREVEVKLRSLQEPIKQVKKAAEAVEKQVGKMAEPQAPSTPKVIEVQQLSLTRTVLSGTPRILAALGIIVVLLYFLLASGDMFLRKVVRIAPRLSDKKRAVEIARGIQQHLSYYLFTITLINVSLGLVVALAMYLLALPNPLLWGAMVAALNFVPYIGAAVNFVILTLVAILTFDDLSHAALVPAVFLALTVLEGQIVTPMVLGRRLSLNPVIIFISVTIWGWMWGIVGILIAVPLLLSVKIICEHIDALRPIAELLEG